uniref:Uncharacterized protein n=1 Tax=Anopheles merus TaxID=30066 RepID=A0A182VKK8_ANOME
MSAVRSCVQARRLAKAHRQRRNQQRQRPNDKDGRPTDGFTERHALAFPAVFVDRTKVADGTERTVSVLRTKKCRRGERAPASLHDDSYLVYLASRGWGVVGSKWTKLSGLSWGMGEQPLEPLIAGRRWTGSSQVY